MGYLLSANKMFLTERSGCLSRGNEKLVHFEFGLITLLGFCQFVHCMEQTPSSEAHSGTVAQHSVFMEPASSLPRSLEPTNGHYAEPVESSQHPFL